MSKTILLCGSRTATPTMREFAATCVRRAFLAGYSVICGDALGVDQWIAESAILYLPQHSAVQADTSPDALNLWTLCDVYGLADTPRNGVQGRGIAYQRLQDHNVQRWVTSANGRYVTGYTERVTIGGYRDRDEWMVRHADMVLCLWNGNSKGTYHVFEYASAQGKPAYLWRFGADGVTSKSVNLSGHESR